MLNTPFSILVMGVSGSGKSHVGRLLAERCQAKFIDADDYHSAANVAKMARLEPLDDADRADWLATLAELYRQSRADGEPLVIGCSALKASYRGLLRGGAPDLRIVYLDGDYELLSQRLASRQSHFFGGDSMLRSQLETLEPPPQNEAIWLSISQPPLQIVEQAVTALTASFNS
ncbi:MAG: gluconokinase [Motiliproteus sp.]